MANASILLTSLFILMLSLMGTAYSFFTSSPTIKIQSIESKTGDYKEVYNQIQLKSYPEKDVWLMRQSHLGPHLNLKNWDELMIVVDKKKSQVSYHQLKDGRESEYLISCFICHANGPRLIRPDPSSLNARLGFKDKIALNLYNLRIKTYGRLSLAPERVRIKPLKYSGKLDNTPLKVKTCAYCHNSDTPWGRGELVRQQSGAISHLVETKQMPPWPFSLSEEEKLELKNYIAGF
jgi:hypothetical protein